MHACLPLSLLMLACLPLRLPCRRDALASAPKPGQAHRRIPPNKKTYQQDPANYREVRLWFGWCPGWHCFRLVHPGFCWCLRLPAIPAPGAQSGNHTCHGHTLPCLDL